MRRCLLAFLLVLPPSIPLAAQSPPPRVRDSAGVRIVENGARAQAPEAFTLARRPRLEIHGAKNDSGRTFYSERNARPVATRRHGGGALVASGVFERTREKPDGPAFAMLHAFDATGRLEFAVRLPAEVTGVAALCQGMADTLFVGMTAGKTLVMTGRGVVTGTLSARLQPEGCFGDGTVLALLATRPGSYAFQRHLAALTAAGRTTHDFGWLPGFIIRPIAMSASVFAHGRSLVVADPKMQRIEVYDGAGTLVRSVRTADAVVTGTTRTVRGTRLPELADVPPGVPALTLPAYGPVMGDPLGRLWVADYDTTGVSRHWTAFDSTGAMLGRLTIPKPPRDMSYTVTAFHGDEVQLMVIDRSRKRTSFVFWPLQGPSAHPEPSAFFDHSPP